MRLILQLEGAAARLTLRGEFDAAVRDPFLDQIGRLVAAGHRDLTIDLRFVSYFGSRAVTALLRARARLHQVGGVLRLERPSPAVRATLEALDMTLAELASAPACPSIPRHSSRGAA